MGEEIANAITNAPIGEPIDEDELENELDELEQEQIDERMTKTGTVPVADEIDRLPAAANGERKSIVSETPVYHRLTAFFSQGQNEGRTRRGRRRRGITEITGRDGHVINSTPRLLLVHCFLGSSVLQDMILWLFSYFSGFLPERRILLPSFHRFFWRFVVRNGSISLTRYPPVDSHLRCRQDLSTLSCHFFNYA